MQAARLVPASGEASGLLQSTGRGTHPAARRRRVVASERGEAGRHWARRPEANVPAVMLPRTGYTRPTPSHRSMSAPRGRAASRVPPLSTPYPTGPR